MIGAFGFLRRIVAWASQLGVQVVRWVDADQSFRTDESYIPDTGPGKSVKHGLKAGAE